MGFVVLGYWILLKTKALPAEKPGILLDTDWFYIKAGKSLFRLFDTTLNGINRLAEKNDSRPVDQSSGSFL